MIIQSEAFDELKSDLKEIKNRLIAIGKEPKDKELDNQDMMTRFHVSKRTLQTWRDEGKISFIQVDGKIYYRESDVEEFLKKHYKKAFKK